MFLSKHNSVYLCVNSEILSETIVFNYTEGHRSFTKFHREEIQNKYRFYDTFNLFKKVKRYNNLIFLIVFLFLTFLTSNYSKVFANNDSHKFFSFSQEDKNFNVFTYKDSNLALIGNPILGLSIENLFNHSQQTTTWGFNLAGRHSSGLSFSFIFNDNIVYKSDYYNKIDFLNKQGRILTVNNSKRSEFSETMGYLKYENNFITIGMVKDNITFGEGKNSKLILSNRAPSFPALFYQIKFTDWFSTQLIHGWLISGIKDSSKSYSTSTYERVVEHEKYFALHSFQFDLFDRLTLRLGETIIYSDRGPYLGYMLPFVLFRSIDHMFTYGSDDSGNNGSLFFDGNFKFSNNLKFYGSLFIDELSLSNLLKGNTERNQFGFLTGLAGENFLDEKLSWNFEYTRILPWVYSNWIPAQTYTNNRFPMGHYIGQNSDQIYVDLSYKFIPELEITLSGDYTRNGGFGDIRNQYSPPGEKFLYGPVRKIFRIGGEAKFKYLENIFINFEYDFYNVSDEDPVRTPDWQRGKNHFLSLRMFYGLDR